MEGTTIIYILPDHDYFEYTINDLKLTDLNDDCMIKIFNYLSLKDQRQLSLTSKYFMYFFDLINKEKFRAVDWELALIPDQMFAVIGKFIEKFSCLSSSDSPRIAVALNHMINLQELRFVCMHQFINFQILPTVKILYIESCQQIFIENVCKRVPFITEMVLRNCTLEPKSFLRLIQSTLPVIHTLKLLNLMYIQEVLSNHLFDINNINFINLHVLHIECWDRFQPLLIYICEALFKKKGGNLQYLHVVNKYKIPLLNCYPDFLRIISNFKNLEILEIYGNITFDKKHLKYLSKMSVKKLILEKCNVSLGDMVHLITLCPKVEEITFRFAAAHANVNHLMETFETVTKKCGKKRTFEIV